jgi:hypothetical protein
VIGFFVGQVMKETGGSREPQAGQRRAQEAPRRGVSSVARRRYPRLPSLASRARARSHRRRQRGARGDAARGPHDRGARGRHARVASPSRWSRPRAATRGSPSRARGFDVAIVDVKLPDASGVDLIPAPRGVSPSARWCSSRGLPRWTPRSARSLGGVRVRAEVVPPRGAHLDRRAGPHQGASRARPRRARAPLPRAGGADGRAGHRPRRRRSRPTLQPQGVDLRRGRARQRAGEALHRRAGSRRGPHPHARGHRPGAGGAHAGGGDGFVELPSGARAAPAHVSLARAAGDRGPTPRALAHVDGARRGRRRLRSSTGSAST